MRTPSSQKCRLDLAPPWADRFILGVTPSITARYFSAGPSDSTSRWTPCPPEYGQRWLQVSLGCVQLSPSCPFRPLHTFRFLRPARLRTPLLGYGAPHLSARGTSTLLNNALLSAHSRLADHPESSHPLPYCTVYNCAHGWLLLLGQNSAPTKFSPRWAQAAWATCIARPIRSSAATSRLKCSPPRWRKIPSGSRALAARLRLLLNSIIRTSSLSTRWRNATTPIF